MRALIEAAGPWNDLDQLVDLWKELDEGPDSLPVETAIADLPVGLEWALQLSHSSDLEKRRLAAAVLRLTDHEALRAMGEVESDPALREQIVESLLPVEPLQWEPPSSGGEPMLGVLLEVFPRRGPRTVSRSRVGGYPDLPPRTAWPEKSRFLMQIDLAELLDVELPDCSLPSQGLISFFDITEGGYKGENKILYFHEPTQPTAPPLGVEVLPEAELRVRPASLYPSFCFESGPEYEVMKPYDYARGMLGSSHGVEGAPRYLLCDHIEIENSPFMDEFGFIGFVLCAVLGLDDRPGALVASELSFAEHLKRLLQREGETLALLLTGDMGVT